MIESFDQTRPHDDAMIAMLRQIPEFAAEYLRVAFEELVEARGGMAACAAPCTIPTGHTIFHENDRPFAEEGRKC